MSWMFALGLAAVIVFGLLTLFGLLRNGRADVPVPDRSVGIDDPPGPRPDAGPPAPDLHSRATSHGAAGRLSSAFAMMNPPLGSRGQDFAMGHAAMGRRTWANPAEPGDLLPAPGMDRDFPERERDAPALSPPVPGMPGRPSPY